MDAQRLESSVTSKMVRVRFLYALIPTAIAYLLYYMGVQKIRETSRVPVIASIETVVSVSCGVFLYGEHLKYANFAGIGMVLASIIIIIIIMNLKKKEELYQNGENQSVDQAT